MASSVNGTANDSSAPPSDSSQASTVHYPVFLYSDPKKDYNILKFSTPVDFSQWKDVTASRDLSMKKVMEYQGGQADEMPEFGAGSEYGKRARDEARRRKRGITKKKLSEKDMPIKFKVSDSKQWVSERVQIFLITPSTGRGSWNQSLVLFFYVIKTLKLCLWAAQHNVE